MRKIFLQKLCIFLLAIAISQFASPYIYACQCDIPDVCQAYTRADKVFVGKLIKIEDYDGLSTYAVKAFFEVSETFKGTTDKIQPVVFSIGSCERKFVTGLKYFVYAEPPDKLNVVCNLTQTFSESSYSYKYAKSLSDSDPVYNMNGVIDGLSEEERKKIKITVEQNNKIFPIKLDEDSTYNFVTRNKSDINVKIEFPFSGEFETLLLEKIHEFSEGNKIEYSLKFRPNECDSRAIIVQNKIFNQNKIRFLNKRVLKTGNSLSQCSKIKLKSQS